MMNQIQHLSQIRPGGLMRKTYERIEADEAALESLRDWQSELAAQAPPEYQTGDSATTIDRWIADLRSRTLRAAISGMTHRQLYVAVARAVAGTDLDDHVTVESIAQAITSTPLPG